MHNRLAFRSLRLAFGVPLPEAAPHRTDTRIAHLLQGVGGECGAVSAPAVQHDLAVGVRNFVGDVILQNAAPDAPRPRQVPGAVFVVLADIDQDAVPTRIGNPPFDIRRVDLRDPRFCFVTELLKCFR